MTAYEALQRKYVLEASLNSMRQRHEELTENIPELKYRVREAQVAQVESEGFFQRLRDRIRGAQKDSEEAARAVRVANAMLETAQTEQKALAEKIQRDQESWESLGDKETLLSQLPLEQQQYFLRMEAGICAEKALHYLRKARKELAEAQELARNPMMRPGDGFRENSYQAKAGELTAQCRKEMEQIARCGFPMEMHPYLQNPMGYLVTARRYGELDQMNSAMDGIRETETALKELLLQLAQDA